MARIYFQKFAKIKSEPPKNGDNSTRPTLNRRRVSVRISRYFRSVLVKKHFLKTPKTSPYPYRATGRRAQVKTKIYMDCKDYGFRNVLIASESRDDCFYRHTARVFIPIRSRYRTAIGARDRSTPTHPIFDTERAGATRTRGPSRRRRLCAPALRPIDSISAHTQKTGRSAPADVIFRYRVGRFAETRMPVFAPNAMSCRYRARKPVVNASSRVPMIMCTGAARGFCSNVNPSSGAPMGESTARRVSASGLYRRPCS